MKASRIILCVDDFSQDFCLEVAKDLRDHLWGFSINRNLYYYGSKLIYDLRKFGNVFADISLYRASKTSIKSLISAGANFVSVYCTEEYCPTPNEVASIIGSRNFDFTDLEKLQTALCAKNGFRAFVADFTQLRRIRELTNLSIFCRGLPTFPTDFSEFRQVSRLADYWIVDKNIFVNGDPIQLLKSIEVEIDKTD